ncbi:MAG: tetratricopeptide repeat protein [Phycisphaerales bacterium]|nr:MAG: tetratricopeptide repeat protein [Phycisphaerales bacterium]
MGHIPPESSEAPFADATATQPESCGDSALSHPAPSRPYRWRHFVPVGTVLLIFTAFMPALSAGFVHWDDDDLLMNTTRYRVLSSENVEWMFTTSYTGHFQPLTWLTYSFDFALWGLQPFGFHLTNVILHSLTALALYFVVRRLIVAAISAEAAIRSKEIVLSAGFAAVLFAVHPLRAESVAWIAERRDVLSGFLYALSVAFYLRYASQKSRAYAAAPGRKYWFIAAVLSCVLSLMAKASAITLPFVLLIIDVYPRRRLGGVAGWWRGPARMVWMEKLPFLVLAIAAGIRALVGQAEGGALYSLRMHGLAARFAQACHGLVFYIAKTVWPTNLGPLYEIPAHSVLLGPRLWGSLVALVGLAFLAIAWRRRFPAVPAALAVYAVVLAPVLGFAQSGPQLVADRYSYLSCMSFAVLAGAVLMMCFQTVSWWATGRRGSLLGLVVSILIAVLGHATFRQADVWQSPMSLWDRGVRVSPNSAVANTNYADVLVIYQRFDEASQHYRRALEITPNDPVALHHFADLLRRFGQTDAAIAHYLNALRLDPNRGRAALSLARLLVGRGRAGDAVLILKDTISRNSHDLQSAEYLARLLCAHPDEGIRNGEEAVALASHVSQAHHHEDVPVLLTLAAALAEAGRFDESVETAEKALRIAEERGADTLIPKVQARLTLFRERKAYRLEP